MKRVDQSVRRNLPRLRHARDHFSLAVKGDQPLIEIVQQGPFINGRRVMLIQCGRIGAAVAVEHGFGSCDGCMGQREQADTRQ